MKKYILLILITVSTIVVKAQTSRGTLFTGGSLGYTQNNNRNMLSTLAVSSIEASSFDLNATLGYFISNKTAVGIFSKYTNEKISSKYNNGEEITIKSTPLNIGFFGRRYFMLNEKIGFTGTFGVYGVWGGYEEQYKNALFSSSTTRTYQNQGFGASINGGFVCFATPHLGIEANMGILGYTQVSQNEKVRGFTSDSGFSFGLNTMGLNLGLYYYIF